VTAPRLSSRERPRLLVAFGAFAKAPG